MYRSLLFLVLYGACAASQAHPTRLQGRAYIENAEPGVLVVALGDTHITRELGDVQLEIISKAARNGPVLVLVTSSNQQASFEESCKQYNGLCDALHNGFVRVTPMRHQGPWVRDYGPFVGFSPKRSIWVVDAKYDDTRHRQSFEYVRESLNETRQAALEDLISNTGTRETDFLIRMAYKSILAHGAELAQLYKDREDSRSRAMDDDAPFQIAQATFGYDRFELIHSPIYLDGGNLFRLKDESCLTTTDTIAKNGGDRSLVEHELTVSYHCKRAIFLEALSGEHVIKHIDMFLMPVRDNVLLLATYDPMSLRFRERFSALHDGELRAVTTESAIAMAHNKNLLQNLGYVVIDVPSLLPRKGASGVYFPTLLNGIVQVGRDRNVHLLLPDYETTDEAEISVKKSAFEVIRHAFGSSVDMQSIESTAPARFQGALHCLTSSVPLSSSLFDRDDNVARLIRERASAYNPKSGWQERREDCMEHMFGRWLQVDRHWGRHGGVFINKSSVIDIDKTSLQFNVGGNSYNWPYTSSCADVPSKRAVLNVDIDGNKTKFNFRNEGNVFLIMEPSDGDETTYVKSSASDWFDVQMRYESGGECVACSE